jgi:hypothetical protein
MGTNQERSASTIRRGHSKFTFGSASFKLSKAQMLLISFFRVSEGTTSKVPYEELVIQAWRDFPESFSLRNHPEHPDASDIHKALYQSLKTSGLIVPLGNKVFRLTDKGVRQASQLLASAGEKTPDERVEEGRLARSEEAFIKRAVQSRTFSTWEAGQSVKLVDYDARMFFQFSTATPVDERKRRLDFARESIEKAQRLNMEHADELANLAQYLVEKFPQLFGKDLQE